MPVYDCGDPECGECQRAFGPDRTKAIENYRRREAHYATMEQGPTEMDQYFEKAGEVVDLIRSQNWKNGGVMAIDRDEAIALIEQLLRAAYAAGNAQGASEMGVTMLQSFDKAATRSSI